MAKLAVQRVPLASEVHGVPLKRRLWRDIVQKAVRLAFEQCASVQLACISNTSG